MALTALLSLLLLCRSALAEPNDAGWQAQEAGRFADARATWLAEAEAGDADAAFGLGVLYDLGQGVPSDNLAACSWYERAGLGGQVTGAFNAAVMHDSGRCGPDRTAAAAAWYARAAAAGLGRAQFNIAQLYAAGDGVPRNPDLAAAWYRAAAANGVNAAATRTLPATPPVAGPLKAVSPVSPAGGTSVPATDSVPLVWTAPQQPVPVKFFVELRQLGVPGGHEVMAQVTGVSAILAPLPVPARYAWRVSVVDVDGQRYLTGPWQEFTGGTVPR